MVRIRILVEKVYTSGGIGYIPLKILSPLIEPYKTRVEAWLKETFYGWGDEQQAHGSEVEVIEVEIPYEVFFGETGI